MSIALALARIDQIERALEPPQAATQSPATTASATAPVAAAASTTTSGSFSNVLQSAMAPAGVMPTTSGVPPIVAVAEGEVGQAEQPPGSNDSPRIAAYRQATAGSGVGPWCAYFVSWAARQAGTPLGDQGQGFGSVDALSAWAQRTGRAVPNGPGVVPRPGDLILFHEHVGLVESVLPDGRIQTIEGNSSDRVSRNVHAPSDALEYVRMI
jgi:cell wall-associated NlpC family hydrolase